MAPSPPRPWRGRSGAARRRSICLLTVASVLALSGPVLADGIADGNAGVQALNRGDYDGAIRLFTQALRPGELSGDDREFAYLNRGNAYAAKGDYQHAVADLKEALRLKPDDADAQSSLQAALAKQAGSQQDAAAPPTSSNSGDPWGLLAAMQGRYYWYQAQGQDPHKYYEKLSWVIPQQTMSFVVQNKDDQPLVAELKLDEQTGEIIYVAIDSGEQEYGTVRTAGNGAATYLYVNDKPMKILVGTQRDGSISEVLQTFSNGRW